MIVVPAEETGTGWDQSPSWLTLGIRPDQAAHPDTGASVGDFDEGMKRQQQARNWRYLADKLTAQEDYL